MEQPNGIPPEPNAERMNRGRSHREALAGELLNRAGEEAEDVQSRRETLSTLPRSERERRRRRIVGRPVGAVANLRGAGKAAARMADPPGSGAGKGAEMDVVRVDYPEEYADLGIEERNILIRFCDGRIQEGCEGSEALAAVRSEFGWPYPDRTFYVGPWKAARMRRRKIDRRRAARAEAERAASGDVRAEVSGERAAGSVLGLESTIVEREVAEKLDMALQHLLEGEAKGAVELSAPSVRYRAVRQEGDEWDVRVRARVDRPAMRRLFAETADLLFPGVRTGVVSRAAGDPD